VKIAFIISLFHSFPISKEFESDLRVPLLLVRDFCRLLQAPSFSHSYLRKGSQLHVIPRIKYACRNHAWLPYLMESIYCELITHADCVKATLMLLRINPVPQVP
jgi:hypothetical protein